jgi:hypothetical protein
MTMLKSKRVLITTMLLAGTVLFGLLSYPLSIGSGQSTEPLPTAGVDGRMIYRVQPGDSCISISARFGVDYKTLLANNNLTVEDCAALSVGREILLGVVSGPTSTPLPTQRPAEPTPTPSVTTGRICVILFEDTNGNALFEGSETAIAGGAISITDRLGTVSLTGVSRSELDSAGDWVPTCFDGVPQGDYNVSMAIPEGYNATMNTNYPLVLHAGDDTILDFGAQYSSLGQPLEDPAAQRSPLLAVLGAICILVGVSLAIWRGFIFISKRD